MLWWMIAKLKSDNPATRLQAVAELSGTEGPRAADALAQALKDKDWELQAAAVRALINRNDPRAQTHLVQMLATRWSAQAADLLVTIGEQAIAPLVGTLTSLNGQSWEALKVLKRLGWKAQSLVHRAMCAVVDGKYSGAAACGPVSLDPLLAALKQKHIAVDEIVRALGELGDVRAISPIVEALGSEFGPERSAALEALKKIGPASTDALAEALKHENPRVREGAALALGEMGDVRRVEALLAALADPN